MDADTGLAMAGIVMSVGATAGMIRTARRTPRQENREDFTATLDGQDKILERQGKTIDRLENKVERLEDALDEQKKQCAEERKEDRRLINALTRILRAVYRHNQALSVPEPVLDPGDLAVLQEYNIP